jgi:hypothetical protein
VASQSWGKRMIRALLLGLLALASLGAAPTAAKSRLFADEAPLRIVIIAPFPALVRSAPNSTKAYPATLSVTDGEGPALGVPIQLSARGHFRRTADACVFPPLLLRFDKATAHGTLFQGQHKLKLTTYCRPPADYEQRIVLEYLAYRLYNLMTPVSFRVRAAEITYRASERDAGVTRFGFLTEDPDDLAERNDRIYLVAATHQVTVRQLDAHAAARAALFEYMIGNLDWDFLAAPAGADCCHNSRLIAGRGATPATASGVAPAPYDFDFSGFVDAPYAGPPPGLPIDRLTDRFYRGYCASNGEVASVVQEYGVRRADMIALINGEPRLTPAFRTKAVRFMDGFFTLLNDPARVQREILRHCR